MTHETQTVPNTVVECMREFLKTCPLLSGERLNVDFLPPDVGSYSIDVPPVQSLVQKYIDGTSKRQFLFTLSSTAFYGPDIRQNLDNLGFYEQFEAWLEGAALPALPEGKTAQKVEALSSGYAFLTDENAARYQIQCRLYYFQGRTQ